MGFGGAESPGSGAERCVIKGRDLIASNGDVERSGSDDFLSWVEREDSDLDVKKDSMVPPFGGACFGESSIEMGGGRMLPL